MFEPILATLAIFGSGMTAGVLFSVALAVVPAFLLATPELYIEMHKLIGRNFDRIMPPTVVTWTGLDVVLATRAGSGSAQVLFALAAAFGVVVALVSQLGNVPINRVVKATPAGPVAGDWDDPRHRWRAFHLVRTVSAVLGFAATAAAVLLTS